MTFFEVETCVISRLCIRMACKFWESRPIHTFPSTSATNHPPAPGSVSINFESWQAPNTMQTRVSGYQAQYVFPSLSSRFHDSIRVLLPSYRPFLVFSLLPPLPPATLTPGHFQSTATNESRRLLTIFHRQNKQLESKKSEPTYTSPRRHHRP